MNQQVITDNTNNIDPVLIFDNGSIRVYRGMSKAGGEGLYAYITINTMEAETLMNVTGDTTIEVFQLLDGGEGMVHDLDDFYERVNEGNATFAIETEIPESLLNAINPQPEFMHTLAVFCQGELMGNIRVSEDHTETTSRLVSLVKDHYVDENEYPTFTVQFHGNPTSTFSTVLPIMDNLVLDFEPVATY